MNHVIYYVSYLEMGPRSLKTTSDVLKKLNIELPYDPAIPFLGMHPKEWKAGIQTDTCTPMFIASLFTTAKR